MKRRFSAYSCLDAPEVNPCLPDGLSFQVWTPTMRHPFPSTLGWMHGVAALCQLSGIMPHLGYSVVYVCQGARIIHRSCTFSRCFRWMFMGESDVQISSTWTDPEFRNQGIASATSAFIMRTIATGCRRFWYICLDDNEASQRTCRRVGFKFAFHVKRSSLCGISGTGWYSVKDGERESQQAERWNSAVSDEHRIWYGNYYARKGAIRNDLRLNREVLFQTLASERSVVRAFQNIHMDYAGAKLLDVGCGHGGTWFQFFRLGVQVANMTGIDIQEERLKSARELCPKATVVSGDATKMPFATASFDLVSESTMFATIVDVSVRERIAAEMLRVCKPNGYLMLVDWRTPTLEMKFYKALTRNDLRSIFGLGKSTDLIGVSKGALVPPLGRFLSKHAEMLYFPIALTCPFLVGQVVYVLQKKTQPYT